MAAQFNARLSTDLAIENFSGHRVGGKHQRLPAPQWSSASRRTAGVRLLTRNGHDWADHYPLIAEAAGALQVRSFLLDGEGRPARDGMPVFEWAPPCYGGAIRARMRSASPEQVLQVFVQPEHPDHEAEGHADQDFGGARTPVGSDAVGHQYP